MSLDGPHALLITAQSDEDATAWLCATLVTAAGDRCGLSHTCLGRMGSALGPLLAVSEPGTSLVPLQMREFPDHHGGGAWSRSIWGMLAAQARRAFDLSAQWLYSSSYMKALVVKKRSVHLAINGDLKSYNEWLVCKITHSPSLRYGELCWE